MSALSSRTRLGVIAGVFAIGLAVVLLHLWILMVHQQDAWARRSYENRWAFRSVPSQRGAVLDRLGRVLVRDQATTKVSVYYRRFRMYNAVGAAVHGARRWSRVRADRAETAYGYREGPVGPTAAVRELLDVPVTALQRGVLPKGEATPLMRCATTVLAACSGFPRRQVYASMRKAAQSGARVGIGDVLTVSRPELLDRFDEQLRALQELDRRIGDSQAQRADRLDIPVDELPGLFDTLEELRVASLTDRKVEWRDDDGKLRQGSLLEDVRREFAIDVSFELAAALRVDRHLYAGIEVYPAVTRVYTGPAGVGGERASLQMLLGRVFDYDRTLSKANQDTWFDRVADALPPDWLDELVPEGLVQAGDARERLRASARRRYQREVLQRERRGVNGIEGAFDGTLSGRLGMRFVEHDAKRREQLLWSHLRVEAGGDVRLTIDADLQTCAERAVDAAFRRFVGMYTDERDQKQLEAALAIIDAGSGDVLAYAGAPIVSANPHDVPGVVWTGNGSIGSVVKPFVLVEQLESQRLGLPHKPIAAMEPCTGKFRYGGRTLSCNHGRGHWEEGRQPVVAIAKSCNHFFYQAGLGLQNEGVRRALRRFGLFAPADEDGPFAACWQARVNGLPTARPRMYESRLLPQRAIGYGVQASPLHVARAYAAIATGSLPQLGLHLGDVRGRVELGVDDALDVVREGLRRCLQPGGTGRRLERLRELDVHGKTGTAEISAQGHNNAWFAGYLPQRSEGGVQLAFCAVVYRVPDATHGGEAAGNLLQDFFRQVEADPRLQQQYVNPEGGR